MEKHDLTFSDSGNLGEGDRVTFYPSDSKESNPYLEVKKDRMAFLIPRI